MLIDSNIVIYAAKPEHEALRRFIARHVPAVSVVSYVEVVGYHRLTEQDRRYFEDFFIAAPVCQSRSTSWSAQPGCANRDRLDWATP